MASPGPPSKPLPASPSSHEAPGCKGLNKTIESELWLAPIPVHVVTDASILPCSFLEPDPQLPLVVGFDCEGVDLARYGRLCIMQDPEFWAHRPLTEMMKRVAADDVRFLLQIHNNMKEILNEHSSWRLEVRGALYCRCFCMGEDKFSDWPAVPRLPVERNYKDENPQEEILAVVDVPHGKMGRVIGKKGFSILSIKKSCRAHIFTGGTKGPPDKVFVIGAIKEVRKAEALLRGRML